MCWTVHFKASIWIPFRYPFSNGFPIPTSLVREFDLLPTFNETEESTLVDWLWNSIRCWDHVIVICRQQTASKLCYFSNRHNYGPMNDSFDIIINCQSCCHATNLFSVSYWQEVPCWCWKDWGLALCKLCLDQLLQVFFWTSKCYWEPFSYEFSLQLLYWGYMWKPVLFLNKSSGRKNNLLVGNSIRFYPICWKVCRLKQCL